MKKGINCTPYDLKNKSIPSGSETHTHFSAKKVLGKAGSGERRAEAYKLDGKKLG